MPPPRCALAAAQSAPAPARIHPCLGHPQGKKKKQAALWQQPGTGTETCAHQLLLLAAPWLCHPPRRLLSLCQQHPAAVTSTVRWHSLSPAPPRTFLCPPHSPGCGQSLLSPSAARISSGVDFSLVVPVCPPALWLLRLSRGRRLARECHFSALAPSCPLRVCSASSPLFAACLLPGAAQGQGRATEPSPAAFALPALSCSEISPSRSAVPSRRAAPASGATAMVSSVSPQPSSPPRHRHPVGTELGTAPRHPPGSLYPKTGEENYPASWGAVEPPHHQTPSLHPPELLRVGQGDRGGSKFCSKEMEVGGTSWGHGGHRGDGKWASQKSHWEGSGR